MSLSIRVPGSKSMTQRALVIAALAERPATLLGALPCDDSALLSALLAELGVAVEWDGETWGVYVRQVMEVLRDNWTRVQEGRPGKRLVIAMLARVEDAEQYAGQVRRTLRKKDEEVRHGGKNDADTDSDHDADGEEIG